MVCKCIFPINLALNRITFGAQILRKNYKQNLVQSNKINKKTSPYGNFFTAKKTGIQGGEGENGGGGEVFVHRQAASTSKGCM